MLRLLIILCVLLVTITIVGVIVISNADKSKTPQKSIEEEEKKPETVSEKMKRGSYPSTFSFLPENKHIHGDPFMPLDTGLRNEENMTISNIKASTEALDWDLQIVQEGEKFSVYNVILLHLAQITQEILEAEPDGEFVTRAEGIWENIFEDLRKLNLLWITRLDGNHYLRDKVKELWVRESKDTLYNIEVSSLQLEDEIGLHKEHEAELKFNDFLGEYYK